MEIKEKGTEVLREQLDAAQKVPHILFYSILHQEPFFSVKGSLGFLECSSDQFLDLGLLKE